MDQLLGCQSPSFGLSLYWKELDYIAGSVDNSFCSKNCPCGLTNTTGFEDQPDLSATYSKYELLNVTDGGKLSFLNCSSDVQTNVQVNTYNTTAFGNFSSTILLWNVFEESFNCTGWCNMTYINPEFNQTSNTCMSSDKISPCSCTDWDGSPCDTCVDRKDNRTACTNYIRPTKNIEKYLFTNINK